MRSVVTTRKRIVGTGLAAAVIGLSGLGAVAATGSEAPAPAPVAAPAPGSSEERCAEAASTWPMGDEPIPEGCGCDQEALAAAIAAQPAIVLVEEDGGRRVMEPEDFTSPAMVEACPDLPAMRERAKGY